MTHLTEAQINLLRGKLINEKQELENRLKGCDSLGLAQSLRENTGELSAYDNHPADLGSETFERGKDLALFENLQHQLDDVIQALEDMETGQYGICKASGQPIPYQRLEALPTAQFTIEHAPDTHRRERPVEEEFLTPAFGRTSLDERRDETEFDGEDAWQIVEQWGTSNTPAMAENRQVESYDEMEVEADEHEGYVEALESFLATDIYGRHVTVVRNKQYRDYLRNNEGEALLEDTSSEEEETWS